MTVYRGRFAPSPTGPLHFGSIICAVASYVDAKAHHGTWLVRMEDVDRNREQKGAAAGILDLLAAAGLNSDEPVIYQKNRDEIYKQYLDQLDAHTFHCQCTRKALRASAPLGIDGLVYPGTCREENLAAGAIRVHATGAVEMHDLIRGPFKWNLAEQIGDFIIKRSDQLFAYQLAVVADDISQNITHVIRGMDLLHSTPRQIHLYHLLGIEPPTYMHLPLALNEHGDKLSKQTFARAIEKHELDDAVTQALRFLGLPCPLGLSSPAALDWGIEHWSRNAILLKDRHFQQ